MKGVTDELEHSIADDIMEVNASFATLHATEAAARKEVVDMMNRQLEFVRSNPGTALCFVLQQVQGLSEAKDSTLRRVVKRAAARYGMELAAAFNCPKMLSSNRLFHLIRMNSEHSDKLKVACPILPAGVTDLKVQVPVSKEAIDLLEEDLALSDTDADNEDEDSSSSEEE